MNKNYKDTLLMPKTKFDMRANLTQKEPLLQQYWKQQQVYQQLLQQNQNHESFILHDGPPYANGDLHLGHALNKILKDFIIRYYNSNGFYAPFIPGWDTHGLPIEQAITSQGVDRKATSSASFRQKCQTYAMQQIAKQKKQFLRLGMLSDFNDCYVTYKKDYEAEQIRLFAKMIKNNIIYRDLYPVFWSPSSESALAEAEIEYQNKKSMAIYVAFNLVNPPDYLQDVNIVIWTTTPWTIPANQMVAVQKSFAYQVVIVNNQKYLIAASLITNFLSVLKTNDYQITEQKIYGKDLINLAYYHPLYQGLQGKIIHSNHVTLEAGSGIVHIAPGFGVDDFQLALAHKIKVKVPIDDQGKFTSLINDKQLEGKFYEDTNQLIIDRLQKNQRLISMAWLNHSYPFDWRTKKPVIYRATWQWFIAINKIKPKILANIDKINFLPEWGKKRMTLMTKSRNDWCISRQRVWGVPIPVFYSEKQTIIIDENVVEHVANLIEKYGSNIWYEKTAHELLPQNYQHPDSPNNIFYQEKDTMDVWYDSGISHLAVLKKRNLKWPADLYLEGNDQFRGWFNSSLTTSIIATDKNPYQQVIAHGFVNDEKGNKMSKSIGNVISVQQICQAYGADILRLWVASVNYQDDSKIGSEILKQISENYRKIRNLIRFLIANLHDFDHNKIKNQNFSIQFEKLAGVDQYMLIKLNNLVKMAHKNYQSYQFNSFYHLLLNFITNDLSAFYCDYSKDILYVEDANNDRRRQIQMTMYYILITLLKILQPILPHTCEEAYHHLMYEEFNPTKPSLLLESFPKELNIINSTKIIKNWTKFLQLRLDINQALSKAQTQNIIKVPMTAKVVINWKINDPFLKAISVSELAKLLVVSTVTIKVQEFTSIVDSSIANIEITNAEGSKCSRCWLIVPSLNKDICSRCADVLAQSEIKNKVFYDE